MLFIEDTKINWLYYMHISKILKYYQLMTLYVDTEVLVLMTQKEKCIFVVRKGKHILNCEPNLSDMNSSWHWQNQRLPWHHEDSCFRMFMKQRLNLSFLTPMYRAELKKYNPNMHTATLIVLKFQRADMSIWYQNKSTMYQSSIQKSLVIGDLTDLVWIRIWGMWKLWTSAAVESCAVSCFRFCMKQFVGIWYSMSILDLWIDLDTIPTIERRLGFRGCC